MRPVPDIRVRRLNRAEVNAEGRYVLYWMVTTRRPSWNFSLDRAVGLARELGKPLLVLETLKADYPWASDRLHRFMLEDMGANAEAFARHDVRYLPFVERKRGEQEGLVEALAENACVVVSDDFPCFFIPKMLAAVAESLPVRLEVVDSIGLLPLRASDKAYPSAYAFRRFLHKSLPDHLAHAPSPRPLSGGGLGGARIARAVGERWPAATADLLGARPAAIADLPIDHAVGPAAFSGGHAAAGRALGAFFKKRLERYADDRNHPDDDAASGLSPYLHFGHLSAHQIFADLARREDWSEANLSEKGRGAREGFWGMSAPAEAFIDEFVTWRELGQNMCVHRPDDYHRYASLPAWAKETLAEHQGDAREHTYTLAQLENAETHDPVWNAAQTQIVREGRLHNYLRMLWGKNVLAWTKTPETALGHLVELNNKYGVDGRDANSYAGIFWVFGRYDRPWPTHPVFGKVRMMTSKSTLKKLRMREYMRTFGKEA